MLQLSLKPNLISAKPWERRWSSGGRGDKEEQRSRERETEEGVRDLSVPFGHSLCWTLINGHCSL